MLGGFMLQGGTAAQSKAMRIVFGKTCCNNNLWKHALGAPWAIGALFSFLFEEARRHQALFSPNVRLAVRRIVIIV